MLLSFLLSVHSRHQLANKLWARRFFINKHFSFSQRNYLDTMLSCYLFLIISLMISFRDVRGASDSNCTDNPVFTPSALVVKYGDPANATCFACQKDCSEDNCGLEKAVGKVTQNGTTMFWTVDRLTEWDMPLICYYNHVASGQCSSSLDLTLYQPPESVSFSFVNHTGMMFENQQYTLQCSVQNVAPVQSLTVTFYRGNTALGHLQSNHSEQKKPVNETFTLNITPSREDDGAQYWCETKLELGPAGPQRPPVVTSEKLPAIVHYGPELMEPQNPDVITITEGDTLHLNCSSVGNPSPSYTWTLPTNSPSYSGSVLTIKSVGFEHEGQYICTVSNTVGTVTKEFNVDVQASPLIWIIAGVSAAVLFVFIVSVLCFRYYKQNRKGSYNLKDVLRFPKRTALPLQNCENV